ncbi:MAG: hypothetical protein P4L28_00380 [Paludibacteraceae bacterium]|nr:hypothetical protein [Paludibacteraceae bacterium]
MDNQLLYSPINEKQELDELVDKIINKCPEHTRFSLYDLIYSFNEPEKKISYYDDQKKLAKYLESFGYFDQEKYFITLNEHGRETKRNGGHLKSLQLKKEESERRTEKENLEVDQLRWFVKTKWLPLIFSGLALIISILALLRGNK